MSLGTDLFKKAEGIKLVQASRVSGPEEVVAGLASEPNDEEVLYQATWYLRSNRSVHVHFTRHIFISHRVACMSCRIPGELFKEMDMITNQPKWGVVMEVWTGSPASHHNESGTSTPSSDGKPARKATPSSKDSVGPTPNLYRVVPKSALEQFRYHNS